MINSKNSKDDDKLAPEGSLTGDAYTDLKKARLMYRITIAALSVAVLFLVVMVSGKKTEVVVMPPDYYEPVIVDGNYANHSYTAGHAIAIAVMLGNISPRNVDFVTEKFMRMLSPRLQSMLTNALDTEAKLLVRRRARQTFEVDDVMFRNADNIVWIWGTKSTTVGANTAKDTFTYEFRLEPNNGIPKITHFDAYPGKPQIRRKGPVEVTPYLTRDLSLVKQFATGEIEINIDDDTSPEGSDTSSLNSKISESLVKSVPTPTEKAGE